MTRLALAIADIAYWPVIQLSVSAIMVTIPANRFSSENLLTRPKRFERSLRFYRIIFVPRWKKHLPDWASLVGGQSKKIHPYDPSDRGRFLAETRRAEIAHWIQLVCTTFCWIWNPLWAASLMTMYGIAANGPCILAQRYNRIVLLRRSA